MYEGESYVDRSKSALKSNIARVLHPYGTHNPPPAKQSLDIPPGLNWIFDIGDAGLLHNHVSPDIVDKWTTIIANGGVPTIDKEGQERTFGTIENFTIYVRNTKVGINPQE